jgi:hypothetical protein
VRYTTEKIQRAKATLVGAQLRLERQRALVEAMIKTGQPDDAARALLETMENSLYGMLIYLAYLERHAEAMADQR